MGHLAFVLGFCDTQGRWSVQAAADQAVFFFFFFFGLERH